MIKSSTAATTKSPSTQLPPKSAWAKGPPLHSPRSQSPAPNNPITNPNANGNANGQPSVQPPHQIHSRRPSALGGAVPIKDGVSVPRGNLGAAKQGGAINFGSVNEQQSAPIASSSPALSQPSKSETRHVQSFGSISAQQPPSNANSSASNSSLNRKSTNGTNSSISSASTTPSLSSSVTSTAASTPSLPNFDVKSLFRGSGTPAPPSTSQMSSSSYQDTSKITSPQIRSAGLPPHSHPSHQHPSQQHSQNGGPHQPQPQSGLPPTPHFGSFGGPRQGGGGPGGGPGGGQGGPGGGGNPQPPRSPSYPRQMSNGMSGPGAANGARPPPTPNIPGGGAGGPAGPTPPNTNATNVNANANAMPSPRLGPPQHHHQQQHPGHPQHQHPQMQPMHGQPMQNVPGMQGMQSMQMPGVNVPPPISIPGWGTPYYPQYYAIPEHYLAQGYPPPPQWQAHYQQQHHQQHHPQHQQHHPLPLPHQSPAPSTPHAHGHGLPVSPRQPPPPPLQPPGTPPAGVNTLSINTGPGGLTSPPPSARLNSGATTFVPGHGVRQSKVIIKDPLGQEVDLTGLSKKGGVGANSGSPVVEKVGPFNDRTTSGAGGTPSPGPDKRRSVVRMETEDAKKKRIAAEEEERARKKEKEEEEKKRKEEELKRLKAEEEKKKAEEEEREKERQRLEEQKRKEEEEERLRLEEEERIKKENEEKERLRIEEERIRLQKLKEEEEEMRRKEEEEMKKKEEEEREKERIRKELERQEQERMRREEEEQERARTIALAAEEAIKTQERIADSQLEPVEEVDVEKSDEIQNLGIAPSPIPSPSPALSESHKRRPIPGPLDLSSTNRVIPQPLSSALATARHIQDLGQVAYPEGITSPKVELNVNAKDGRFRYDREFLLQFMNVCKEKPDNLPPLDAIGMEPIQHPISRTGSSRGRNASAGPSTLNMQRQQSIGLGITGSGKIGGAMGQFTTIGKMGEERFGQIRSASSGSVPANSQFGGRPVPLGRTPSQGGPNNMTGSSLGSKRTRSKRGEQRNEGNRINAAPMAPPSNYNMPTIPGFEPIAPLEQSANRWVANSTKRAPVVDTESPEIVDRKVRALLNKLSMEKFDSISNQIIAWANRSEKEKDGRTLIQVIRLVFEKATDEANWSEMYARLCRKMMEQISPNVQDETIKNTDGKPITGGQLFRKYLLNRCQEDFERGWTAKEKTAAAAAEKANEDKAVKEAAEKSGNKDGEAVLYSEEYYAAQKAKRQGLGLVKFIGELFKLQMLTERIMHECIKKALSNVDDPEEEEIESLCKLLTTVGQLLDTSKAHLHMDVYFTRIRDLSKSQNVTSRMQFMLQDIIELRDRKWIPRSQAAAPSTIAQVHEAAAKEKQEKEVYGRTMNNNMSRGGSRRGTERGDVGSQPGADGWTPAARVSTKAGDLSNFGKINKPSTATMNFAPVNVFTKKDVKGRESHSLSRTNSSSNMYSLLEHSGDAAAHPATSSSTFRASRPPSRMTSVDLTHTGLEIPTERPKLMLQKRSIPLSLEIKNDVTPSTSAPASASEEEEGELKEDETMMAEVPSMTVAEMDKKIEEDIREFFSIRNLDEAEVYFTSLPGEGRYRLVNKLVMTAIEKKEADAKLVGELFERAADKDYCNPTAFEKGFMPTAELLDDIAIDAPKAIDLMAFMLKGAKLDDEIRSRIANKSESSERLLSLTTS